MYPVYYFPGISIVGATRNWDTIVFCFLTQSLENTVGFGSYHWAAQWEQEWCQTWPAWLHKSHLWTRCQSWSPPPGWGHLQQNLTSGESTSWVDDWQRNLIDPVKHLAEYTQSRVLSQGKHPSSVTMWVHICLTIHSCWSSAFWLLRLHTSAVWKTMLGENKVIKKALFHLYLRTSTLF